MMMRNILVDVLILSICLGFSPGSQPTYSMYEQNGRLPDGWRDLSQVDSSIVVDIKYASEDNFTSEKLYDCPRCLLRTEVAESLLAVQQEVKNRGLRIKIFDCYRPHSVQQRMWEIIPDARYVTPPSKGSMHNRGLAVDLTLIDSSGEELDMGSPYDSFGKESHHTFKKLPDEVLRNREYLKTTMERHGFKGIQTEWWHYSYLLLSSPIYNFNWPCPGEGKNILEDH